MTSSSDLRLHGIELKKTLISEILRILMILNTPGVKNLKQF